MGKLSITCKWELTERKRVQQFIRTLIETSLQVCYKQNHSGQALNLKYKQLTQ